ncbi:hypothetical protein O1L68_32515 [Streptomyces lydicus]|nr:hypothetical protein [Streptomyces lydicus]
MTAVERGTVPGEGSDMVAAAGNRVPGRISVLMGAAGVTWAAYKALRKRPPGGAARWERKNYAGRIVDLHAGLATATGTALAAATAPGCPPGPGPPRRWQYWPPGLRGVRRRDRRG